MERSEIVDGWLAIATRDLCPAAKERIALEIKAHFGEAVVAHVAEGLPLLEAELRALEELGDAEAAGRRFRRRHLKVKEFEFAEKTRTSWSKATRKTIFSTVAIPVLFAILIWNFMPKMAAHVLPIILPFQIAMVAAAASSYRTTRSGSVECMIRKLALINVIHCSVYLLFMVSLLTAMLIKGKHEYLFAPMGLCPCLILIYRQWISIAYKSVLGHRNGSD